jgi:N-acetylglucosamine-binding protein A
MKKLITILSCLISSQAFSHGYVSQPESRSDKCALHENSECGGIQYEPQSLEANSNSFLSGGLDNHMGSVGISRFSQLDYQSTDRWEKNHIKPGNYTFDWTFTTNHRTSYFRFYITKQNWNPNRPLTVDEFDKTPFCELKYDGSQPPMKLAIQCLGKQGIPNRTGYQVIMADWGVADTVNSFYNLIDVNFD